MKKLFSRLLLLSLFTFLIMSMITYNVNAQVKKNVNKKDIAVSSSVKNQGNIKTDIVQPPLPVLGPRTVTTCYPVNAAYNTGSVDPSGTKTQTSIVKAVGTFNSVPGEQGWMKFDISSIPTTENITKVELNFYVTATNFPWFYVNQVTSDPVTAPGSTIYSQITGAAGTYFNYTGNQASGWNVIELNGTARTHIQSLITSQGWWACGFYDYDDDATLWYFNADGWNETNKPYITVTTSSVAVVDAQTTALWMPTRVPQITFSPFVSQNIPWAALVKNNGTGPATFNDDAVIYKNTISDATFVSTVTGLTSGASQTLTGNYNVTSSANYNFSNLTLLAGDGTPANDYMYYGNTCAVNVNDSVFAWDDGVYANAYGLTSGGASWWGNTIILSAPDTLTSATVRWGSFGQSTAGAVELWNTSGGVPTTLNTTIASVTLTAADNYTLATYMLSAPLVLPAGTYFLLVHQINAAPPSTVYIAAFDNGPAGTPWTVNTSPRNVSYYSSTGTTWSENNSVGLYGVFTPRANFGMVPTTPVLSAVPSPLSFGYIPYPGTSTTQTYSLSGFNLTTGPIVVTAPTGFEVSLDGSTWFSTVNVTFSPPALAPTTIYVHFKPLAANTAYSGNITNIGGGGSANVAVTGTSLYGNCAAGASIEDEFISNVTVGTINNTTLWSTGGYGDYTAISTNMIIGTGYPITVTNGNPYSADQCGIWVDWNIDGDFVDAGESMTVTGTPGIGPYTATITPPPGATVGSTRMRVRLTYTGTVAPCGTTTYGEVEDYTINVSAPAGLTLGFKALIQGFYDGISAMVPDTVTIELRNSTTPFALVESKKVLLSNIGTASPVFTVAANSTPYYIVVKHRNLIETWSANPQVFSGGALTYDFTTSASQAYGSNQVFVGNKWCMYNGDVNQDRTVDIFDMLAIDADVANFVTGYVPTDLNGDQSVDIFDMLLCDNNVANFVGAVVPPGAMVVKVPKTYEQMKAIEKYMKDRIDQKNRQANDKIKNDNSTAPLKKSNTK